MVFLLSALSATAQLIRSAAGPDINSILTTRDQFRLDLGGGIAPGPNGSFGGVRREINWDGVPDPFAAPNNMPPNFFNVNSPRGVLLSTPGTGLQVSGNAGVAPIQFDNINPTYSSLFEPFSPQRLFTPLGSNIVDVVFVVPGSTTPALTRGFGAIFSDVDLSTQTKIELYGLNNALIGPPIMVPSFGGNQSYSFLGITFPTPVISRVRITLGNAALAPSTLELLPTTDLVTLDDFLYGEPVAASQTDLAVTKSAPATVAPQGTVSYSITVTNGGPDAAQNVTLTDALPAGINFVSLTGPASGWTVSTPTVGTNGTVLATATSLANGGSATFTVTGKLTSAITPGTVVSNTATVAGSTSDPNGTNNTATAVFTVTCPTITVSIPDAFALPSGVLPNAVYPGYAPASSLTLQAQVSGGTTPYQYTWSTGSHASSITVSPTTTTIYSVSVTDATGCPGNSASKTVEVIDVRGGRNHDKVVICHKPGELSHTLTIGQDGVADHLEHGDMLGACPSAASRMAGVTLAPETILPNKFTLSGSPNPVSRATRIQFALPTEARISISIYDAMGREVNSLFTGTKVAGTYSLPVNTSNFKTGIYYCRMTVATADGKTQVKTQTLVKTD